VERWKARALAWAVLLVAGAGCAVPTPTRNVLPTLSAGDVDSTEGYETPPVRRAANLLPPELLEGPHHRVRDEVASDGFLNRYVIESDFGTFEAAGDELLRIRIHEIEALAELDRMQKRDEFARAMAAGLKSPFVAAWNLIRDPVDSILGIPQSAWETVKKTAELTRRERGELEDSGFREFIGFETKKRELAFQLGVDPYTSNKELQKQLNRFAWAAYLGGLPFALVPFQDAPAEAEIGPASENADERLRDILRHYAPEDLRRLNRIELAVMGAPPELADRFLTHLWYSPRHGTILIESLVALDLAEDRPAFIETALAAGSEADARFYQRAAQLLRAWHEGREELVRVAGRRRAVMGLTAEDELVVPLVLDHAVWSRPADAFATRALEAAETLGARRVRLLVSGTLSERARAEFAARGFAVTEQAFERLDPRMAEVAP
jgi:hypothetical protein